MTKSEYEAELKQMEKSKFILIPENATNGDVIQILFPDVEIVKGYGMVHIISDRFESVPMSYELWNKKYKGVKKIDREHD